jgi:signal transduction histidine kinase
MQGFKSLPAKMHSMFSFQANCSTQSARALRWLVAVWIALALMGNVLAQSATPKVDLQGEAQGAGSSVQVKQTLWIDESRQLDFESARTQEFKPFNPFERLNLGNKVAWLRLQIEQADPTAGPLLLHFLPPHIGEVTLYTNSSKAPELWRERQVDDAELTSKIKIGEAFKGDIFYLRISSRNNASVLAFLGTKEEMNLHDSKLAVVMTFISTLTLITFFIFVWRTLGHFSWMSVLCCSLLVSYQIQFWIGLGYAYTILNLPLAAGIITVTPNIIANLTIAGGILVLIGCTLFPNQKWLRWVWGWSFLQFCFFVYAFIEPSVASRLSMSVWLIGPLVLAVGLIVAAIREPSSLRLMSSKVAFVLLLTTCLLLQVVAWKSGGILGSHNIQLTTDLLIKNIFVRFPQLIVIIVLASWIFERIRANQLNMLSVDLQKSKESLEMESKRLERQRKFTAMLAHELKNPLAVSHMALSGIESRLGNSDPMMERAAAIKQSLQDINAIIDRCSEIDGFEQGDLPMSIHSFSLDHFLSLLKEANANERIYFVKRGVHDDASLTSDMQYLKIIFNNLLTNALKYSPPDTLIELSVQAELDAKGTKSLNFCVSNEVGEAGTPAPDRAFERFYRAEAARNQSGAGLGLWLSQELAHALGIEVVMQQDDDKISFSLVLPYA